MKFRPVSLAAGVLAVVTGCTMLSGCTGKRADPAPTSTSAAPKPAVSALARAWSAQHGDLWKGSALPSLAPALWTTPTAFIVPGTQSLTSYSSQTGAKQWTLRLPEPVCTIASGPNSAGLGAVLMGTDGVAGGGGCARAGAVDTRTGRLLWTKSLKGLSTYGLTNVAVGPSAVVATSPCDTAVTMAVRTGKTLVKLPAKASTDCLNNWASDGITLVDGQKFDAHGGLVGYDVVSGRRLWAVRSHADAAHDTALTEAVRVVSSDPLVVEASINQHIFLRRINPKAGTATAFGREDSKSSSSAFIRIANGRLVVQYDDSQVLFTYDLATGRQTGRVVLDANERIAGLRGDAVITVGPGSAGGTLVVRSTDAAMGAQRALGVIKASDVTGLFGANSVSASTLLFVADGALNAYHLPTSGPLVSSLADPIRWVSGDIRPRQVVDLCTGITAKTTRAFGFLRPAHAAPASCGWAEKTSPNAYVQLSVGATASVPTATRTAVQVAHSQVVLSAKPSGTKKVVMTPLAGLGDEAMTSSTSGDLPSVTIYVRRINVVVRLYASSDDFGRTHKNEVAYLTKALRVAAQEMVTEVDRRH